MEINKKKYFSMLGLITISIFIIGASYAYFTVSTTNNFGTHTISGTMEDVGAVSLVSSGNNISLNLTAADMMRGGEAITYFGTTDGRPTDDRDDGIIELAHTTVTGPGYYDCDYTIQITASGTNSMYTAFQNFANKGEGQITLEIGDYDYFYGTGDNGEFYDFNTASLFPITYNGTLSGVSGSTSKSIYGIYSIQNSYLINQTALAGTDITMTASVTSFTCTAIEPTGGNKIMTSNPDNLTSSLVGGMYRYQGTYDVVNNNYICFGTSNASICKNDADHYMYRIIGITEDGEIYVIKKEALNTEYNWHSTTPAPLWPNSNMYSGINGNYYLSNTNYVPAGWENKIVAKAWKYGVANNSGASNATFSGDAYYTTYEGWAGITEVAKISLMYPHDYLYAYPGGTPGNKATAKTAWIHLAWNDDGNSYSTVAPLHNTEWTNTALTIDKSCALDITSDGQIGDLPVDIGGYYAVTRPVMYLSAELTIEGSGTLQNPYVITN